MVFENQRDAPDVQADRRSNLLRQAEMGFVERVRMKRALVWLRRDLRLSDHSALAAATGVASEVAVAFVFDRNILDKLEDRDDRRVTFIHQSLQELDSALKSRGSSLIVLHGDPVQEIPRLAKSLDADAVFAAQDHEPYALKRDATVGQSLDLRLLKDQVVLEAQEIGQPYKVFTPYFRAWQAALDVHRDLEDRQPDLSKLMPAAQLPQQSWSLNQLGFQETDLWLEAGEKAAHERLRNFRQHVAAYGDERDFPALEATSGLSVHLRFGTISIRECVRQAYEAGDSGRKWFSELVWREFYQSILQNFPHVVQQTFQPAYRDIEWVGNPEHFAAWKEGRTGYPLVDAGIRCFNATGWMHNRLRMVVASFLTKDLLLDYRSGEAYFARKLLDFDLASNNGGWQWAASVGCDAQPYFRIFNPVLQSLKFDPDGAFIHRWIPELLNLRGKSLHAPWEASPFELLEAGVELGKNYPERLVDHQVQKELALAMFRSVTKEA